jgi:hypothetical protein
MELPREPSTLPQARRYERTFDAPRNKVFTEGETVIINIPPIKNTYLSKDVKLHFDFTLSYQEASSDTLQHIYADIIGGNLSTTNPNLFVPPVDVGWATFQPNADALFSRSDLNQNIDNIPTNAFVRPIPTFDVNGPYGLINRIRVYDFLGTTLLEDVQEHDVLTAMLTDFDLKDNNFTLNRPNIVDAIGEDDPQTVRKWPCSLITTSDSPNKALTLTKYAVVPNMGNGKLEGIIITPGTVTVSNHFALDLYSFLGKLSDKFVPLHNGFRIEFTVNKASIPISFGIESGGLQIFYKNSGTNVVPRTLDPTITEMSLSSVYLKSDLLEVKPELDEKIDKLVHYQGFKYQRDFFPYTDFTKPITDVAKQNRPDFTKVITERLLSLNKVMIGQRLMIPSLGQQKLGFRIKNYVDTCSLLFNKSVLRSFRNTVEVAQSCIQAFGMPMDYYLTMDDYSVEAPNQQGTGGFQYPFLTENQRLSVAVYVDTHKVPSTDPLVPKRSTEWFPTPLDSYIGTRTNFSQGKYMAVFDTRLPGTTSDTVGGIDTSKNTLEYKITATQDTCWKTTIDVFCQHDALLRVDPGKSTTVSF